MEYLRVAPVSEPLIARGGETDNSVNTNSTLYGYTAAAGTWEKYSVEKLSTLDVSWFKGFDVPHYHQKVREGKLLPHTPYRAYRATGSTEGAYKLRWYDPLLEQEWGSPVWITDNAWKVTSDDCEAAIPDDFGNYVQEAAAAIYDNGFDALTFLAELSQLRHLFGGVCKTLLTLRRIPRDKLRWASSEWLAARYGWRPLLYEINSFNEALDSVRKNNRRKRYSENRGWYTTSTVTEVSTQEKAMYDWTITTRTTSKIGLRGSVTADIEVPPFQFNPLRTGWEVIPFSFVFDWFVSVGKSLSALSFLTAQSAYSASKSVEINLSRTMTSEMTDWDGTVDQDNSWRNQSGSSEARMVIRVPCLVSIVPQAALRINTWKIMDLLALVFQRLH